MKAEIILTKEEIAKVFLCPPKNPEDLNSVHCHISTLDNESDISSTSLNLESEFLQGVSKKSIFNPDSPVKNLKEKNQKTSELVIYEKFDVQNGFKSVKTSELTDLIEKLAELSKKYEKVQKTEDNLTSSEKIDHDSIGEDKTQCREIWIGEPEIEKNEKSVVEEVKRPEKSESKNEIKNSLTQIAKESRSKKPCSSGKSTQVVCAKCSII